jgi:pimeloyl-ACP methyl ester carboxylesterase
MAGGADLPLGRRQFATGLIALPFLAGCANSGLASPGAPPPPTAITLLASGGREVAISRWQPAGPSIGAIAFSHGAGSAPDKYLRLFERWVAAGWTVFAPLHVDSREHPRTADYPGLASWRTRIEDMRLLSAHIGDTPYIAAGHSYGGLVALALGGAQAIPPEGISGALADGKVCAVVALSPPAPIPVLVTEAGYATLAVPALVQTGTADIVPGITAETAEGWRGHLVPFEAAAPGGHRYALVLEGVDHYFGGAICDFNRPGPPQLARLADTAEIAGLFMDAYGARRESARHALHARLSPDLPVRLITR